MAGEAGADNMAVAEQQPRQRGPQQNHPLRRVAAEIAGAAALLSVIAGGAKIAEVGPFHNSDSVPQPGITQKLDGGMPSANVPLTTDTAVATAAAKTPEAPKTIDCGVFSPEICAKYPGEVFEDQRFPGIKLIGFNLPEGTPIFAYRDGVTQFFDKTNIDPSAHLLLLTNPAADKSSNAILGSIKPAKDYGARGTYTDGPGNTKIKDQIGTVQDTGFKMNGFNVVMNFEISSNGGFINDNKAMQDTFPNAKPLTTK